MGCQLVPAPKISYMQAPRVGGLGLARVTPGAPSLPSGAMVAGQRRYPPVCAGEWVFGYDFRPTTIFRDFS